MKTVTFILLVCVLASAQILAPISNGVPAASSNTTFTAGTKAQTGSACPASTTCSLTITSTTLHNVGLIMAYTTNGAFISSVSGAGTWVAPAGCQMYQAAISTAMSCAYNLDETSGVTSVTVTWTISATAPAFAYEPAGWTGTTPAIDGTNAAYDSVSQTSQPGVSLLVTGASDLCIQGYGRVAPTAISGAYTTPTNMSASARVSDAVNTNSGAAPTWTLGSANTGVVNGICLN